MKRTKSVEPTFDYTKFKNESISMSTQKFMSLPDFYRNRDVENRITKMVKRLEKGACPTHLRMAVGKAIVPFGGYKKNEYFKLDGHTRTEVYKICPHLIPNVNLIVDVYEVISHEQALSIYYNIDSQESVETSSDKITGLLRESMFNPKTKTLREGKFKTVLNQACRYGKSKDGLYLNDKKYNSQFNLKYYFFLEELKFIDNFQIDKMDRYSSCVFSALLLITKKYGVNNKRISLLIENFRDDIAEKFNGHNVDGVHYVYHVLYATIGKDIWKVNSNTHSPRTISHILYAFDKFMRNETISKKSKYPNDQQLREFFQFYLS
jgi:hypothetical protein